MKQGARHISIAPRTLPEHTRIDFQFDEMAHGFQRVAEEIANARRRTEEIADHREGAALDSCEEQGRAADFVHAPLDLGHLQIGVDLLLDAYELPVRFRSATQSRRLR